MVVIGVVVRLHTLNTSRCQAWVLQRLQSFQKHRPCMPPQASLLLRRPSRSFHRLCRPSRSFHRLQQAQLHHDRSSPLQQRPFLGYPVPLPPPMMRSVKHSAQQCLPV